MFFFHFFFFVFTFFCFFFFFFQAEDGIRDKLVTGVQTCALPICYTQAFAEVFTKVADEKKIPLVPFFLDGVGGHPDLMQGDGLHPAAAAQDKLRSEERRVGKECRSRWSPYHEKKKKKTGEIGRWT